MNPDPDTLTLTPFALCERIRRLTCGMMGFWTSVHGLPSVEAAGLLDRSMLEWQASLSSSLENWLGSSSDGDLILAWTNLGALVEGQLKLFLSVHYEHYRTEIDAIRYRSGHLHDPGSCTLESLRQIFVRRVWAKGRDWNPYVELVQSRRDAIHAFRASDIGDFMEWGLELRRHLSFLRDLNLMLPYPDDIYVPREM